jgi:nucleoside-diphosphate-sugar epimerase
MQREIDCLVTGASGFLGRVVVSGLLTNGASVRGLIRAGNNQLPDLSLAGLLAQSVNSQIVRGNLLSPAHAAQAVDGVRVVYHLAAETRGLPATVFAGTVVGSKNLLQAILRARPQRVVLISSLNVYGLANASLRDIVTEDAALDTHPERRDVYTHAKIWQERLFQEYLAGSGIELTIVRSSYIYGPGQRQLPVRLGLRLGGLLLQTGSRRKLAITYIDNCADAVIFCGTKREAANEAYNIVDDDAPTDLEYLERYCRLTHHLRVVRLPFAALSALCYVNRVGNAWSAGQIPLLLTHYKAACSWRGHQFSSQKLRGLGWRQPIPTEEALALAFPDSAPAEQPVDLPLRSAS